MKKAIATSKLKIETDANQAVMTFGSDMPYLCLNSDFQICDCNELFESKYKISKKELLASNLTLQNINTYFIEAARKAGTFGISTFHGKVQFGSILSETYIESVLVTLFLESLNAKGIGCYILESRLEPSVNEYINGVVSTGTGDPSAPYASISVHDPDGSVIYISPSVELLLGYSNTELKDIDPLYPVYPEDRPIVKDVIEKLNSGNNYLNSRYRMIHKNGSIKYVESTSYLITDAAGTSNHIVNVTWDLGSKQGIENALRISEQKYYRLVMNLPVGVSMISVNGQLLEANDSMRKIMRIPLDFPISELNFLSIDAMNHSGISAQFSRCIETKEAVNGEVSIKLTSKKPEKFLAYRFVPILKLNGEIESVIGYVNDLTLQKKAERYSRERADFLNLVINTIKTPFFVKDEDHNWVMLNDAAIEMMGRPREDLIGKSDYALFPKDQADVFWKYDELVFKQGSSSNEEQITWHDGTIHTIVTHKQLYVEKPFGKRFIVGTNHDITHYKKIEEELRASEKKYRELFDNANDFILTTDIDGNITNANRTLLRYLNTDLESITKLNVFNFIKEENLELANDIKAKMLAGESDLTFELKAYGVDRQDVIYEVKASLIFRNGIPAGVQCVFSDVTNRKEASLALEKYNASLLELNKTKDKFFSIIAHDLRNPFSSLIGFSEMLLEDLEESTKDEIRESLKIIYSVAKHSFNLLENLLTWSRMETGHMPYVPDMVILTDAIDDVINVLFSLAYRKKIDINNLVEPGFLLSADKNMLNIILNNLILNAIKFTPVGGGINIYARHYTSETDADKDFIVISVADTGIGMNAETIEKLFTPNRLVSNPGTDKEPGTGLGLLLTSEMIEKHGGRIMVESSPGKGSVFSFLIPAYKPVENS
jgi:PAS domain S-box-containing protein